MKLIDFIKLSKEDIKGKIICFITDTVYGVGCIYNDEEAIKKIYSLKRRDEHKPLAVLIGNINDVNLFTNVVNNESRQLMNKYWPGALTIIYPKRIDLNISYLNELSTIGLRMPNSPVSLEILKHFGPMATTSVNISGNKPINNLEEIKELFKDKIDYYIDDIHPLSEISSTVVDVSCGDIRILRQGSIIISED